MLFIASLGNSAPTDIVIKPTGGTSILMSTHIINIRVSLEFEMSMISICSSFIRGPNILPDELLSNESFKIYA